MKDHPCRKFRFLIPLVILAGVGLVSLAVMDLWNHVLVAVLGVKAVTYWQALGILVLARILVGAVPGRRGGPFGRRPWKRQFLERWQSLSPEEREKLRQHFGDGPPWCGDGPGEATKPGDAAGT